MNVLLVCSGNVGRSQIAMEYSKLTSNGKTKSADTRVTREDERIGDREDAQNVLAVMREDGIDMTSNTRTSITPQLLESFDKVAVMAEPDRIPEWLSKSPKFVDWEIENVNSLSIEKTRIVRDMIKAKVKGLIGK